MRLPWLRCSLPLLAFSLAAALLFAPAGEGADLQALLDRRGEIVLPEGVFVAGDLRLYGGTRLRGVAGKTVIRQAPGSGYLLSVNPGAAGSADPARNERQIEIRDLIFEGRVAEDGFSEHAHLLNFNGVSDLLVDNCVIRGFRGDGIYLGSGNQAGVERHNLRVVIRNCTFDGVNRDNRNAVSIIDGRDVVITGNTFRNCTRADMPGAVDIEPDAQPFHVIGDIEISRNDFAEIGGNVGLIAVVLPFKAFRTPPRGIRILDNRADARGNIGIHLGSGGNATAQTPAMEVVVSGNEIFDAALGLRIFGMRGVLIEKNLFDGTEMEPLIGYAGETRNQDVTLADNVFRRLSWRTGGGLCIFSAGNLRLSGNLFQEWGPPDAARAPAISLRQGESEQLEIRNNRFERTAPRSGPAVEFTTRHRTDPATFATGGNLHNGRALTLVAPP